jgi:GNAT superfamily N-acetyltransferase
LQLQWQAEGLTHGYVADSAEAILDRLGPYFLVGELSGEVVGYVHGTLRVSEGTAVMEAGARYLEVEDLFVAKPQRRSGLGGLLLQGIMDVADRDGVARFQI